MAKIHIFMIMTRLLNLFFQIPKATLLILEVGKKTTVGTIGQKFLEDILLFWSNINWVNKIKTTSICFTGFKMSLFIII